MEAIEWKCNDCGYCWAGDETDFCCERCDGNNIEPIYQIINESREEKQWIHRYNVHFEIDSDTELSTIITTKKQQNKEEDLIQEARLKLKEKGFNVDGLKAMADFLE